MPLGDFSLQNCLVRQYARLADVLIVVRHLGVMICLFAVSASVGAAPANSVIGNQASATYVDATGVSRPATSNTVVTTVTQVKAFTLTANGFKSAPPNSAICYPHTITNTGNGPDTYTLNAPVAGGSFAHSAMTYFPDTDFNGQPDSVTPITSSGLVAAGASFGFVVCATTPLSAVLGQQGTITVSVLDTNAPIPMQVANVDTTTAQLASISVTKKLSNVPPPGYTPVLGGPSPNGGPLFIILDYTNAGTIQADGLALQDILPSGMQYVPGSGRWSGSGVAALTDVPGGDPVGISYQAPTTTTSGTVVATIANVSGATSGYLYFQVVIAASLLPSAAGLPAATNTAQFRYSYQFSANTYCVNGATTSIIALPNAGTSCPLTGEDTNTITYVVQQTPGVAANGSFSTTGSTDTEPVTLASAAPGQVLIWTDYVWNMGNGPDTFDIDLRNTPQNGSGCNPANNPLADQCTFPTNTTFRLLAAGGQSALLDSNGNSVPDTGVIPLPTLGACPAPFVASTTLPVRCGYPIVIAATIPNATPAGNNGGNGFQVTVRASSSFNNLVSDTVANKLSTIGATTVDLTNNLSIIAGATPGQGLGPDDSAVKVTNVVSPSTASSVVTRFRLVANNTSATSQIYDLSFSWLAVPGGTGLATPPAAWAVVFRADGGVGDCSTITGPILSTTGATPVPAGGSRLVCAEITIPAINSGAGPATPTYVPPGNYVIQFGVSQQNDPTVADRIRDQVTLQPVHNVSIAPNGAQATVPGGTVTYTHTITNSGNVAESVAFAPGTFLTNSQSPAFGWTSLAYLDSNSNGTFELLVDAPIVPGTTTISLPPNSTQLVFVRVNAPPAVGSPPNATTITASYSAGANTASGTDTTTLADGLRIEKYQQSPSGTGACTAAPPAVVTSGVPNAPWSTAPIAAGTNTAPGRCIAFLIVGTNNSAVNVTNIVFSDLIPPNTKLESGCGLPVVSGPISLTGGPYSTGFAGTISATSAPLASTPLPPAGTFTLQLCVKINDM